MAKQIRKQAAKQAGDAPGAPRGSARGRAAILIVCIAAAATGIAAFMMKRGPAYQGPVKHVIFISLDTTRPDHFGCYGNEWIKTPEIDRLATESVVLADYMTVVPTTLSSHTTLFTGKFPHSHGVARNGFEVNQANVMLAEVLKQAGFHTAGFLGSFALESIFGFNQGFDYFEDTDFALHADRQMFDQDQRLANAVTDSVISYLDEHGSDENLFLFVHYFDAHGPYDPPRPFLEIYDPDAPESFPDYNRVRDGILRQQGGPTPEAEALAKRYAGEITFMDHHVGRLIEELRGRGILDDAILILTSDHGENFWEHAAYFDHGWSVYRTTTDAMCLIRFPGGAHGGTRAAAPVSSVDLFPTLLHYLNLPIPADVDGMTLDMAHLESAPADRPMFAEATKPWKGIERDERWYNILKTRCIRTRRYKYIETPWIAQTPANRLPPGIAPRELYDLDNDPGETTNLLLTPTPDIESVAADLQSQLTAWTESAHPLPSRFITEQRDRVNATAAQRRMENLGYLDSIKERASRGFPDYNYTPQDEDEK
jgi:arylsulfatase A-like enzyme